MSQYLVPISIILNVYNSEDYIKECLDSIFRQSFSNFEMILTLDGCTDSTPDIVNSYKDERLKIIKNKVNRGVSSCCNNSISLANGKYIVRMDGDDIMHPQRLEKQFHFMENNPEIGVCSSWVQRFGKENDIVKHSYDDAKIKIDLLYGNPIANPSVIIKTSTLRDNNITYNSEYNGVEDYKLWTELALVTKFSNIPEVLLRYRTHEKQLTNYQNKEEQQKLILSIKQEYFEHVFFKIAPEEKEAWKGLFNYDENPIFQSISKNLFFINRLRDSETSFFNESSVDQIVFQCEQKIIRTVYFFGDEFYNIKQENKKMKENDAFWASKFEKIKFEKKAVDDHNSDFKRRLNDEITKNKILREKEDLMLDRISVVEKEKKEKLQELNELIIQNEVLNKEKDVLERKVVDLKREYDKNEALEQVLNRLEEEKQTNNVNLDKVTILLGKINNQINDIVIQEKLCEDQKHQIEKILKINENQLSTIKRRDQQIENQLLELGRINEENELHLNIINQIKRDYISLEIQLKDFESKYSLKETQFSLLEKQATKYRNKIIGQENEIIILRDLVQKMRIKNRIKSIFKKS